MAAVIERYAALGNVYAVVAAAEAPPTRAAAVARRLCRRPNERWADGILVGRRSGDAAFTLRIYNPDGSEAEMSGNGVRIFAYHQWQHLPELPSMLQIETRAGPVTCRLAADRTTVSATLGRVSFDSRQVPVAGPPREVLDEPLTVDGVALRISAATVGNPHCVVTGVAPSPSLARRLGPILEHLPMFPSRTNVQFMRVISADAIAIEIWERGAGYTSSSGSSATAAAAVAHRLGHCGRDIAVQMAGGVLRVALTPTLAATIAGPITLLEADLLRFDDSDAT